MSSATIEETEGERNDLMSIILKTDPEQILQSLHTVEEGEKFRELIEHLRQDLPVRLGTLAIQNAKENEEPETQKLLQRMKLIASKTQKDVWEGSDKSGATWINWSLIEVDTTDPNLPIRLSFKHSVDIRNHFLEEDEFFDISFTYGERSGHLWKHAVGHGPRTPNEKALFDLQRCLNTDLSIANLLHVVTRACLVPFYESPVPQLSIPKERELFEYQKFVEMIRKRGSPIMFSPRRQRSNSSQALLQPDTPTKKRRMREEKKMESPVLTSPKAAQVPLLAARSHREI
ncbi:hypothetical protein PROFUN_01861 [Planoprotostelium fungivorum]|uniref:Uncharacterized protein n=1 Tax=Planoprotostelium fungivorum TaxID=1890364 RepID=A0A2P6NYW1_9EUKA|nr:hypothetical protein PROFUN_01861 [Planoprotostelium fungivorum]